MRGFKAYQIHNAMMLHFNPKSDYDFFKYKGRTKLKPDSLKKDKMKQIRYSGIEKRVGDELELFFFSTYKDEDKRFSKFVPQAWHKRYLRFKEEIEAFDINSDIDTIAKLMVEHDAKTKDLFQGGKELHPLLYSWYSKGLISELTFIFCDLYIERFLIPQASNDPLHWKKVIDEYQLKRKFFDRYVFCSYDKEAMISNWTTTVKDNLKVS